MVGYRPCGSVKTIARISPVTRRSRKHNIRPTTGPLPEESVIKVQYLTTVVTTMLPRMVLHRRAPSSRPDQERTTYAALHPDSHPSCQFVISRSGRYNIGRYYAVLRGLDWSHRWEPCTRRTTSAAISIRRVARLSRNVGQPDHIFANPITSHKAERRPGSGEIWLAVTKHDGVQVDSILIDQPKFGEALRQVRASNFDLPGALGPSARG